MESIRCLGSAALNCCYVANGAADAAYEFGIHVWDYGAGYLIAKESGCVVVDPAGGEFGFLKRRFLCASSAELAQQIIGLITPIDYGTD